MEVDHHMPCVFVSRSVPLIAWNTSPRPATNGQSESYVMAIIVLGYQ